MLLHLDPFKARTILLTAAFLAAGVYRGMAQTPTGMSAGAPAIVIDGSLPPVPPAVLTRDDRGRATLRAVRISAPLTVDGRLDEEIYSTIPGAGDWIQQLPIEHVPATDQTELWVFYDDRNLYIAVRCLDSEPGRQIATELRRDSLNLIRNDSLAFVIDTFYDRRNGFNFQTSPIGAIRDQTVVDNVLNGSWNTVWEVKSTRSDAGWSTELMIPFKSLRYAGAGPQVWGFNARRIVPWKNEVSTLSAVPRSYGMGGGNRINVAGTLVGLETPAASKNLEIKPYAISSVSSDNTAAVPVRNDLASNVGFDFKYGLTRGLIFDATVNTDFAQVEEDQQQVNLTRFSLFFPEKREFFLEGQGIFGFGGASLDGREGGTTRDVPILFFSRRIGLNQGQSVPVDAGGRLTGRVGAYTVGAINVQTDEDPEANAVPTNFTALRLKRNILRRSYIGALVTERAPSVGDANTAAGLDASFSFYDNVSFTGYFAKTTPRQAAFGNDTSYRMQFGYGGDRYGFQAEHLLIGEAFNPEVGYVRRTDFRRTYTQARFSPRLTTSRLIRRLVWQASLDYVEDAGRTAVQNRDAAGEFDIEFNNSDNFHVEATRAYEFIPKDFTISSGVVVPAGGYVNRTALASYNLGQQHFVQGRVSLSHGSLYSGTSTEASYSSGYIGFSSVVAIEPGLNLAWVNLPDGDFVARVVTMRTIITPTPRMLLSSLVQFNAEDHTLSSSVRLRWEYRPNSEFFVVYSDGRSTLGPGGPSLLNRSFAVKVTRLLRF
jgi:hypothetical protein